MFLKFLVLTRQEATYYTYDIKSNWYYNIAEKAKAEQYMVNPRAKKTSEEKRKKKKAEIEFLQYFISICHKNPSIIEDLKIIFNLKEYSMNLEIREKEED